MGTGQILDRSAMKREENEPFLIVGLGNPGPKYAANRHNVGFMTVDRLAQINGMSMGRVKSKALYDKGEVAGIQVILAKPQTYMNKSGDSISQLVRFYKIPTKNVLVIYDELDLPLGSLRLRQNGGSGGHNGMKSVIQLLGNDFPRLRLGIGRPPGRMDPAAFVLRDFRSEEIEIVNAMVDNAIAAIESFIRAGIDLAMTYHNKK